MNIFPRTFQMAALAAAVAFSGVANAKATKLRSSEGHVVFDLQTGDYLAFQDGDGPWKFVAKATGDSAVKLPVKDAAGRFGIFRYNAKEDYRETCQLTLKDVPANGFTQKKQVQIQGTVINAENASRLYAFCDACELPVENGKFALETDIQGPIDLCVGDGAQPKRMVILRNIDPSKPVQVDWSQAVDLEQKSLTVSCSKKEMITGLSVHCYSAHNMLCSNFAFGPCNYSTLPASLKLPTDYYLANATAYNHDHSESITLTKKIQPDVDTTIEVPTVEAPKAPERIQDSPRRYAFAVPVGAELFVQVNCERYFVVSKSWLDGKARYEMPDLRHLEGWEEKFNLPGTALNAIVSHEYKTHFSDKEGIDSQKTFTLQP